MKNQANAAGAVAFLTKPFTAETMQSVLAKILD
jgi:FixJ family two-component response regulator